MALDNNIASDLNIPGLAQLCQEFWRLDAQRVELDRGLAALPENDQRRDLMWLDLEHLLRQIAGVVAQLAASTSLNATDLRAKAAVLSSLLRSGKGEPSSLVAETFTLAVSLADEVARVSV